MNLGDRIEQRRRHREADHVEAMDEITEKDVLVEIYVQLNAIRSLMYFLFVLGVVLGVITVVQLATS